MINIDDVEPRSRKYGVDLGTPIARHYINVHMSHELRGLSGLLMEFGSPNYARQTHCAYEILDIDRSNTTADVHGDICDALLGQTLEGRYDAIICTAVLQLVDDPSRAVENMHRMLRPEGILLVAEKAVSPIDPWSPTIDRWRFTQHAMKHMMRGFRGLQISTYGNVYALCAYMMGLPAEQVPADKLAHVDPQYPIVTIGHGRK